MITHPTSNENSSPSTGCFFPLLDCTKETLLEPSSHVPLPPSLPKCYHVRKVRCLRHLCRCRPPMRVLLCRLSIIIFVVRNHCHCPSSPCLCHWNLAIFTVGTLLLAVSSSPKPPARVKKLRTYWSPVAIVFTTSRPIAYFLSPVLPPPSSASPLTWIAQSTSSQASIFMNHMAMVPWTAWFPP